MDIIECLEQLIRIDSANPFIATRSGPDHNQSWMLEGNELNIASTTENMLAGSGFKWTRQPVHTDAAGRTFYNILAEKGDGPHAILFYAHMDTVSTRPWPERKLAFQPRRGRVRLNGALREVIYGLGASDMKAGMAVLLSAFRDQQPRGYKIKLAFGVDEEFYSLGANTLAQSEFMDDVRAIVVPEITDGPNWSHGHRALTLGRLGRCDFILRVPGTGGHGAQANNRAYVNAAEECAKIVSRLEKLRLEKEDVYGFSDSDETADDVVDQIKGCFYVNRIEAGDGTLSIPAQGQISVSYTFTPAVKISDGKAMLESLLGELLQSGHLKTTTISERTVPITVEILERPTPPCDAYITPAEHPFSRLVRSKMEESGGFACYNMGYSVADENVFQRCRPQIPVLCIGPLGANYHQADEWVAIESVRELATLYKRISGGFPQYLEQL